MMRWVVSLFLALALAVSASAQTGDRTIPYAEKDERMNAAIASARASLEDFTESFRLAPEDIRPLFSLKVGMPTRDGGVEHIWVDSLKLSGDDWSGALANNPVNLAPGLVLGSPVSIEHGRISDWAILSPAGYFGHFTTRVMLADMEPAEAADVRAVLTPEPIPSGWRKP